MLFLKWGAQKWTQWFRFRLRSAEQSCLLAQWPHVFVSMALLHIQIMQPCMRLAFPARANCWLTSNGFSSSLSANLFSSLLIPLWRVIPTQLEDSAVAFVELHKVLVNPLPQPVKDYLNAALLSKVLTAPSNFMSFLNLLRVHSVPSPRLLIKTINSVGPSVDPWGKLQVTGSRLDFVLLIRTLWVRPCSQFPFNLLIQSTSPEIFFKDARGGWVKVHPEVRAYNNHCLPLPCPQCQSHPW